MVKLLFYRLLSAYLMNNDRPSVELANLGLDLGRVCPFLSNLGVKQFDHFTIWHWTSIISDLSCGNRKFNEGIRGLWIVKTVRLHHQQRWGIMGSSRSEGDLECHCAAQWLLLAIQLLSFLWQMLNYSSFTIYRRAIQRPERFVRFMKEKKRLGHVSTIN